MSAATAAGIGAADDSPVEVSTTCAAIVLPLQITEMVDGVVWVPMNSPGASVTADLRAQAGDVVTIATVEEVS